MSSDIFTPQPEAPIGTYPGIVTKVEVVDLATKYGDKTLVRWVASVTDEHGQDYTVDTLTSLSTRKGTKAYGFLQALGLDPLQPQGADSIVGRGALFVLVEDEQGFTKLGDIIAPPKTAAKA